MKVLVVSDSHGRHDLLRNAIGQEAPIDMLIHAGDIEGDLNRILGPKREYTIHAVAGNMDWGDGLESSQVFDMGGHKVFLVHGHHYGVHYTMANLREAAESCHADVAIFGHTHIPVCERQGDMLILNPGSLTYPRQAGHRPSYILLTVSDGGAPDAKLLYL